MNTQTTTPRLTAEDWKAMKLRQAMMMAKAYADGIDAIMLFSPDDRGEILYQVERLLHFLQAHDAAEVSE